MGGCCAIPAWKRNVWNESLHFRNSIRLLFDIDFIANFIQHLRKLGDFNNIENTDRFDISRLTSLNEIKRSNLVHRDRKWSVGIPASMKKMPLGKITMASQAAAFVTCAFALLAGLTAADARLVKANKYTTLGNRVDGPFTVGFDFTTDADMAINALGVEDNFGDGLSVASEAGLWDITVNPSVLMAAVTIPAGATSTLKGGFRYMPMESVITLSAGRTYRIGAVVGTDNPFTDSNPGLTFSGAGMTIVANRYAVGGVLAEPVNDGIGTIGRWVGANATFLEASNALLKADENTVTGNRATGPFTVGFDFTVDADRTINALGVEDDLGDGLTVGTDTGLWDVTDVPSILLASVTIPAGTSSILEDGFRYISTESVIKLRVGRIYRIGSVVGPDTPFTDIDDSGGVGNGFSGEGVYIIGNRYAAGGVLSEPIINGGLSAGRWAGGNAAFLTSEPPVRNDFRITGLAMNPETNTLTLVWNSEPGEKYAIDFSQDLSTWPGLFTPAPVNASAGTQTSYTAGRPGLGELYFRVRKSD